MRHHILCSCNPNKEIGSPGCVCVITYKQEIKKLEQVEQLVKEFADKQDKYEHSELLDKLIEIFHIQTDQIYLRNLPTSTKIHWATIYKDYTAHIHDGDMVWIELPNGNIIDAGQYGDPPFFEVRVIPQNGSFDEPIEAIKTETTKELAELIVKLAHKHGKINETNT